MAGGAPRKWKSVKAMQEAIDAYFKECECDLFIGDDGRGERDKYGMPIIINAKPPTITGLALALGSTGRQALRDYQARPEFADTVRAQSPDAKNMPNLGSTTKTVRTARNSRLAAISVGIPRTKRAATLRRWQLCLLR